MIARRRPVAAFFAALLVWLTAVSAARVALPNEMRWMGGEAGATGGLAIAAARSPVVAPRLPSRSSTIPQADVPLPPAPAAQLRAAPETRRAPEMLARVRRATGLARAYDAIGPPLGER